MRFRIGDYQYHVLLALPEFKDLVWLLAERKTLFGNRVLSQVIVFGGGNDATNAPHLIWSVEDSSDRLYREAAVRHYSFIKAAIPKELIENTYLTQDKVIESAQEDQQNPGNRDVPPAPLFVPNGKTPENVQSASALGDSDPAWQELRSESARSPSPLRVIQDDADGIQMLMSGRDLPSNFDQILNQAMIESERELGGGRQG